MGHLNSYKTPFEYNGLECDLKSNKINILDALTQIRLISMSTEMACRVH